MKVRTVPVYRDCPCCTKRGWFAPKGSAPGYRKCRYCGHDNGVEIAAQRLHKTLDKGVGAIRSDLDRKKKR